MPAIITKCTWTHGRVDPYAMSQLRKAINKEVDVEVLHLGKLVRIKGILRELSDFRHITITGWLGEKHASESKFTTFEMLGPYSAIRSIISEGSMIYDNRINLPIERVKSKMDAETLHAVRVHSFGERITEMLETNSRITPTEEQEGMGADKEGNKSLRFMSAVEKLNAVQNLKINANLIDIAMASLETYADIARFIDAFVEYQTLHSNGKASYKENLEHVVSLIQGKLMTQLAELDIDTTVISTNEFNRASDSSRKWSRVISDIKSSKLGYPVERVVNVPAVQDHVLDKIIRGLDKDMGR